LTNSKLPSFWTEAARRAGANTSVASSSPGESPTRKSIRRDAPPTPAALIPTDDVVRLRLAEELEYARRMLNLMGDELSSDGAVIARHGMALQSVDIVGQMMGHIANVIRSSDPQGAIELIGMGELKARLKRRSMG
jgi:hypothetical protein